MNSRRITAMILRMAGCLHGLRTDEVDENLVERGLGELEAGQPRPRAHELVQDLLRIALGGELELGKLAGRIRLHHPPPIGENAVRSATLAVEVDQDVPPAVRALDVCQRAVNEFLAVRDDGDVIADLLRL